LSKHSYRTKDGRDYFDFSVEQQSNGTYRAYITSMPSLGNRSNGAHETHRYYDNATSRHYICYEAPVYSEQKMKPVMRHWSEEIQRYIRTGEPFRQPNQIR